MAAHRSIGLPVTMALSASSSDDEPESWSSSSVFEDDLALTPRWSTTVRDGITRDGAAGSSARRSFGRGC